MDAESGLSSPIDSPRDLPGCITFGLRYTGCILALYITMFAAIVAVALVSLMFFR